jgi:cysteinyl-tRNA synthetase
MSKSLGNIISIKEFLANRDADVMRMLVLNGSYRAPLVFNDETLDAAAKGLERLVAAMRPATGKGDTFTENDLNSLAVQVETTKKNFVESMDDDFNSAGALGSLFDLVRAINTARDAGAAPAQIAAAQALMREFTSVFGLRLSEKSGNTGSEKFVNLLLEVRMEVRKQKLWQVSDLIRDRLKELNVIVEDSKDGTTWRWG